MTFFDTVTNIFMIIFAIPVALLLAAISWVLMWGAAIVASMIGGYLYYLCTELISKIVRKWREWK